MSDHTDIGSPSPAVDPAAAVDGLEECAIGVLFLVLAAGWAVNPGLVPIAAALAVVFGPRLLRRMREALDGPRPALDQPTIERADAAAPGRRGIALFVAGAVSVFVVVIALTGELGAVADWRRWAGLLAGLLSAGGFLAAGERSGLRRHGVLAGLSAFAGFGAGLLSDGSTYVSVGWYFGVMGVVVTTLGLVELALFAGRRRTPIG